MTRVYPQLPPKPSLRAWRPLPIVDAVGRPLDPCSTVRFRRTRQVKQRPDEPRPLVHLFDFADTAPPEIEVYGDVGIVTVASALVGNCWKFESLLVAVEYRYYLGVKVEPLGRSFFREMAGPWRWARWPDGRRFLHWEEQLRQERWA